ncbi:lipopolysaccharide biosynthesis protein [Paenibacillus sp. JSM ZJ436]|uniref:lipopolysaccharide biosynthesis protein n=1 Tax=Paenibacillus sp. JSM ZJ436 TaxID=3376190 RepID=UPI0037C7F195
MLVTILSGVLLARGLGAEGRGQYIAITMWTNLLYWALSFGVYQTVLYYWKSYQSTKKIIFTTLLLYSVFFCCIAVIIAQFLIVPLVMSDYSSEIKLAGRIYFIGIIYAAFTDVLMASLAGEEDFKFSNYIRMALPVMTTICMTALFLTDNFNILSGLYVSFAIWSVIFLLNIRKIIQKNMIGTQVDWRLMISAFKYGSKSHGGSVAGLASLNSTQMMLSVFLHPSVLGIYSTAQSSISPLNTVATTIGITLQPMLTAEERSVIHLRAMKVVRKSILIMGTCSFILAILLPVGIPFIYGAEFIGAVIPALIMLPSLMLNSVSNTYKNALNGIGRTLINTKTEFIVLVFTVGLLLLFLDNWQLIGAAIVTTIASIIRLSVYYYGYNKHISNFNISLMLPRREDIVDVHTLFTTIWNKKLGKKVVAKDSA